MSVSSELRRTPLLWVHNRSLVFWAGVTLFLLGVSELVVERLRPRSADLLAELGRASEVALSVQRALVAIAAGLVAVGAFRALRSSSNADDESGGSWLERNPLLAPAVLISLVVASLLYTTGARSWFETESLFGDYSENVAETVERLELREGFSVADLSENDRNELRVWSNHPGFHDSIEYFSAVKVGAGNAREPFAYRTIPTTLVRTVEWWTGWSTWRTFMYLNILGFAAGAGLIYAFARGASGREWVAAGLAVYVAGAHWATNFVGGIFVDGIFFFFATVFCYLFCSKRYVELLVFGPVLVLAKEQGLAFVVAAAATIVWTERNDFARAALKAMVLGAVSVGAFVVSRRALGGAALEANFGFDLGKGELPPYIEKRFSDGNFLAGAWWVIRQTFRAHGVVIIPLLMTLRRDATQWFALLALFTTVLISATLSGNIGRPIGLAYPAVAFGAAVFFGRYLHRPEPLAPSRG